MKLVFSATITRVFENKVRKHVSGSGPEAVFATDSAGWYVRISNEISLFCGMEKPDLNEGDKVTITLQRSPNANTQ